MATTIQTTPEMTLEEVRQQLRVLLRGQRVSAYDLARLLLDLIGLPDFERAVNHLGASCPKTLRRVFSQGVRMCMSLSLPDKKEPTHLDSSEFSDLQLLAKEAKVDSKQVLSSLLRYGNPLARVREVLQDIRALVIHECRVTNPTGLFVRLIRSGENVQLPTRVTAKREQQGADVPVVPLPLGSWVQYHGDWLRVERILENGKVLLYAPEGYAYHMFAVGSDTEVLLSVAAKLPRGNAGTPAVPAEEPQAAREPILTPLMQKFLARSPFAGGPLTSG